MSSDAPLERCSFCSKHKDSVAKLIVSTDVAICNECVDLCQDLLQDPVDTAVKTASPKLDPRHIKKFLDEYVIGQDLAKKILSVGIVNHYKRINSASNDHRPQKTNILMLGPTGSGKTLLAQTAARYLDVPFVIGDATTLTEAGYVGDDVESLIARLLVAADNDVERCQRGIIFIDEIDKISRKSESTSITRDVSGEGVQQALLKLVEGTKCRIPQQGGRKHPAGDTLEIDTSNILFIAGGAFVGINDIMGARIRGTNMGFGATLSHTTHTDFTKLSPDDIVKFGMIPEFVGRFPVWVSLQPLTKNDIIDILIKAKNNYIEHYRWLFGLDNVNLSFARDALDLVADNTLRNNTGARGLHTELERVLLPHMYHLNKYHQEGITELVIDRELVANPKTLQDLDD